MSGGSYNYTCYTIENEYCERMHDVELNDMIKDLVKLLRDLEWWQSDDISEEQYRETVRKFKEKWFGTRDNNLRNLIIEEIEKVKETLNNL